MAFSATLYESMQVFVPETWQYYYFNPTLSPFNVPVILSVFLLSIWVFIIVFLAVLDDLFRQLTPSAAVFYLLGLMSCCIFCYFFFILTTHFYVGYLFLAVFTGICFQRMRRSMGYRYRCGNCGRKIKEKGECPYCGAINQWFLRSDNACLHQTAWGVPTERSRYPMTRSRRCYSVC